MLVLDHRCICDCGSSSSSQPPYPICPKSAGLNGFTKSYQIEQIPIGPKAGAQMVGAWMCERVREFESDAEKKRKKKKEYQLC